MDYARLCLVPLQDPADWVWMPHAAHFICGPACQYHLATWVGAYIVSTIGELPRYPEEPGKPWQEIGAERTYETMVFRAAPSGRVCCPVEMADSQEVDFAGYTSADDATQGHMHMCEKWSWRGPGEDELTDY